MSEQTSQNKPTAAYILALLTGIVNVFGGLAATAMGLVASDTYSHYYFWGFSLVSGILLGLGLWTLIAGVIIILAAVKLNSNPLDHTKWGVIILLFSFVPPSILGIIGGILALAFTPETVARTRMCVGCGLQIDEKLRFCPHCGKEASQD
jgi:hypothetical protein